MADGEQAVRLLSQDGADGVGGGRWAGMESGSLMRSSQSALPPTLKWLVKSRPASHPEIIGFLRSHHSCIDLNRAGP